VSQGDLSEIEKTAQRGEYRTPHPSSVQSSNAEDESTQLRAQLRTYRARHVQCRRWRRRRFDAMYAEYDVEVLFGDGRPASSRTLLLKVRASYD
jgi:hypothetical protein